MLLSLGPRKFSFDRFFHRYRKKENCNFGLCVAIVLPTHTTSRKFSNGNDCEVRQVLKQLAWANEFVCLTGPRLECGELN